MSIFMLVIVVILAIIVFSALRVLKEYQRGVIFTFGRFDKVKGPGIILVIPIVQQMSKVDLRTVVMEVPPQDVISRDNVSVKVNAVIYFRIIDPEKAIIQVADVYDATSQLAQTTSECASPSWMSPALTSLVPTDSVLTARQRARVLRRPGRPLA